MSVIVDALRQARRDDSVAGVNAEDRSGSSVRSIERRALDRRVRYDATPAGAGDARRQNGAHTVRGWLALSAGLCAVCAAVYGAMLHPQAVAERVTPPMSAVPDPRVSQPDDPQPLLEEPTRSQQEVVSPDESDVATPVQKPVGRYRLSGIMRTDQGLWAVINGAVVRSGDSVSGAEVIAIDARGARIRANGHELRLALSAGEADAK